ncbi:uncharacterized protein LOC128882338, partial [Hylaeus volcanicus]|uniref:uncharacterized protein LOC128882338 n=1 Tax=Hylaeus volcanicus TaxID=313075 RepID=UPI0023B776D8
MAQLMGDLPKERVNASDKPFVKTAIDFAGPIKVKTNKLRAAKIVKGYICIFVCMVTRAIHLEPVGDLTAVAFIAALRRFAARRGTITDIFSDNATNFVGANSILSELSEDERDQFDATLKEESNKMLIQWHFSPPASPHFNGLAEAAVKSSKFHLKRVIGDSALTFEELATLLCQIEYVLNSRPICELSDDPNEIGALTPAHFLNVANGEQIPDEELLETKISMLSHWQKVQQKFQNFWFRWKQDYLHQLQVRSKWHKEEPNVQIGKLVLLKDENLPSTKWPMGRVVETHPGKDGLIRVVSVKTKNNILKRSVTKIAPLPLDIDDKERADVQAIQRPTACAKRSASVKFPIIALLALVLTLTTIESAPVNGISRSGRHR